MISKKTDFPSEDLLAEIQNTGIQVEQYLANQKNASTRGNDLLRHIWIYCLDDIGVRLRPYLLSAAYLGPKRPFPDVLPVAAAIELIQISTLVIDDVLDDSPLRNGKPSVCAKWGAMNAIAAGMFLSSVAFRMIGECFAADRKLKNKIATMALLERAHGDIYSGQFTDLSLHGQISVGKADYLQMISQTTASFIQATLVAGALLRGASPRVVASLKAAGLKLGLAYQIRDDVIDIIGDTDCTGKPKAGDIRERKMRLPVIHALSSLDKKHRNELVALMRSERQLNESEVRRVIDLVQEAGSIDYAIGMTRRFCSDAVKAVQTLGPSERGLGEHLVAIAGLISCFDSGNN